jgi:hypothetical protein
LRQVTISNDGRRLYVAAPNRDGSAFFRSVAQGGQDFENSRIAVVNIDVADKPAAADADLNDPGTNVRRYWKQIAGFLTGQETYAIETTTDNNRLLFSNRYLDTTSIPPNAPIPSEAPPSGGVCELIVENDDPSLPEMKPFELYLKFSFHLHWDPDHFHENPEVEEMAQAGELEFF